VPAVALGDLDCDELLSALRPLWEDAGPLADALLGRHVESWDEAVDAAEAAIGAMSDATRAELLRAHPRIGANAAELARRSAASWSEQGGDTATPEAVAQRLGELNDAYEAHFGFPFVEWVAGRSKAEMIPVLEARLGRDRATELSAGTAALVAIARDRLARLRVVAPLE
jgi:2-oxo-4-hydroxy-4-carboxy-5-ureidoimidazoline decarboxylase